MSTDAFEDIVENFDFLDDWEDRYRYVIELGKDMPPLPDTQKIDATKVDGCASQVWLVPEIQGSGPDAEIRFEGDSDALIVRGLIAILRALFNGASAQQVRGIDAHAELTRLGLDQHLSSQRSNGLKAMIARVQGIAKQVAENAA